MITLLFWVIILGLIAWAVTALPIPSPFRTIAYVILVLILVMILFQVFTGYSPLPLHAR